MAIVAACGRRWPHGAPPAADVDAALAALKGEFAVYEPEEGVFCRL